MFNFNLLSTFIRVVDSGSFTRAAEALRQPKSRVSRRMAALERDLGVTLLYRTTRQFRPTAEGQALYERCREHVYELEAAAQAFREGGGEPAGVLRVSAPEDFGFFLLGPVLAELAATYPKLVVDLRLSGDYVDLVGEGIDVAIRIGELEDRAMKRKMLGRVAFALVASPAYLENAPRIAALADLADHPTLAFLAESEEGAWSLRRAGSSRFERVRLRFAGLANNPKVLLDMALAGRGVALVPEFAALDSLREGKLRRVLPEYGGDFSPVQFVWPAQRETSPKVRAFVEVVTRRLSTYFDRSGERKKG